MVSKEPSDLSSLIEVGAYWKHKVTLTAVKLDLFSLLAKGPRDAAAIAGSFRGHIEAFGVFLNALVAIGLLEKNDGLYANSVFAGRYLVRERPDYRGDQLIVDDTYWSLWSNLEGVLMTGASPLERSLFHGDPDSSERLLLGLHRDAMRIAQGLAGKVRLDGATALLDVGGGAGTYAIAFCERNPGLRATVFDLPNTTRVTRTVLRDHGLDDRIDVLDGDFLVDSISGSWDVVLMSNVLHGQGAADNEQLLGRVHGALRPGGKLILRDVLMSEGLDSPAWGAVFAVNMLLHTGAGRCYSCNEISGWLERAGFSNIHEIEPGEVVVAEKGR